jgi:predicted DNA-binding transcriptional regulator AlpA
MPEEQQPALRPMISKKVVTEVTGQSENALDAKIANGTFPIPVKIGPRSIRFFLDEVVAWQQERAAERDAKLALKRSERERAAEREAERVERKARHEERERGLPNATRPAPRFVKRAERERD